MALMLKEVALHLSELQMLNAIHPLMQVIKMIVMMEKKFDGGDGEGMKVIEVRGEAWMVCIMKLLWPPFL